MANQRGILNLIHSDAQRGAFTRHGNAMILNGAELLTEAQVRARYPFLKFDDARFPIKGGLAQHRGGTVRHDAVAWGYARSADSRGVECAGGARPLRGSSGPIKSVARSWATLAV
ncbi:MAG: sarcosine oxidase subunit beta [Pseudorhodobacter sp.]|jgi:glycine/D-amino acid oxidase-like deaminating enzyme